MRATQRLPFQSLLHRDVVDGATPFPGQFHFTLDTHLIMHNGIKYRFCAFSITRPGIEPRSRGSLANTLPIRQMSRYTFQMSNSSIWPIDRTLSGATISGQSRHGNDSNTGALPSDCPWCCRYRRRKWTRRYEFKSWTRLIAFHIALIPLGKVWIQ